MPLDAASPSAAFATGQTIWVYDRPETGSWDVLRVCDLGTTGNTVARIITHKEDPGIVGCCRVLTTWPTALTTSDIGASVIIDGATYSNPDLIGVQTISAVDPIGMWFEVAGLSLVGYDFTAAGQLAPAPVVRILRSTRFASTAALAASTIAFAAGDMAYVDDDHGSGTWTVQQWSGTAWSTARQQPPHLDSTTIQDSMLYDTATQISATTLTPNRPLLDQMVVIDPLLGRFPGSLYREIDYRLDIDPARYDGATWGAAQVGRLWWDLSTVRYLDPYTDSIGISNARDLSEMQYRSRHWAQIAPGSSVDIYEWVASAVDPQTWMANLSSTYAGQESIYQGLVYNFNTPAFVTETVFNPTLNESLPVYYFWVLGRTTVPPVPFRHVAAASIAAGLSNPANLDIAWIAPILRDGMLVSGVAGELNDTSTALKVTLATDGDDQPHAEWLLLRQGDVTSLPPDWLWRRLRDSLAGFTDEMRPLPAPDLHADRATGLYAGQSLFRTANADDPVGGLRDARTAFVGSINYLLAQSPTAIERSLLIGQLDRAPTVGVFLTDTEALVEPLLPLGIPSDLSLDGGSTTAYLLWSRPDASYPIEPPPPSEYDSVVFSRAERDRLLLQPDWQAAIRDHVPRQVLLDGRTNATPQWSIWQLDPFAAETALAAGPAALLASADLCFVLARAYDVVVASSADRAATIAAQIANATPPAVGTRFYVSSDETADGFWTLWRYDPTQPQADATGCVLLRAQTYRTTDFYSTIDWYAPGYAANRPPSISYADATARAFGEGTTPRNQLVQLLNGGTTGADGLPNWQWTAYDAESGGWQIVAQRNGTLALSANLFAAGRPVYGVSDVVLADIAGRDGASELRVLADILRHVFLTAAEVNAAFFMMLRFIHTQQDEVDWAFKTSFLTVADLQAPLRQTSAQALDLTGSLIDYLNEVKPYRVKIREVIRQYSAGESAPLHVTDYDKPVYFDPATQAYRVLDPTTDAAPLALSPWVDWAQAYQSLPSPVRQLTLHMQFDRLVAPGAVNLTAGESLTDGAAGRLTDAGVPESAQTALLGALGYPAERLPLAGDDAMIVRVSAAPTPGAPPQTSTVFDASGVSSASVRVPYGQIVQSANGVFVYRDGVRATLGTDYTVDQLGEAVVVQRASAQRIDVHGFGFGGAQAIVEQHLLSAPGNSASFALAAPVNAADLDVVVGGLPTTAFSVVGSTVVLNATPAAATDVAITVWAGAASSRCTVTTETLAYNAGKSWTLAHPDSITKPEAAGVIVEQNGLRLRPPMTFYGDIVLGDAGRYIEIAVTPSTSAQLTLYLDGVLYGYTIPICTTTLAGNGNPLGVVVPNGAMPPSDAPGQFVVYENFLIALAPAFTGHVALMITGQGEQYTVTDGVLSLTGALASSDLLTATTFANATTMQIETSVFTIVANGLYPMVPPLCPVQSLVNVNGAHIALNVDYTFTVDNPGWDTSPFDTGPFDLFNGSSVLSVPLASGVSGYVIATVCRGTPARGFMAWMASTQTPSSRRMQISRLAGVPRDAPQGTAPQQLYTMLNSWEDIWVDPARTGVLTTPLARDAATATLSFTPSTLTSKLLATPRLSVPDLAANRPGVLWVGNERIEYGTIVQTATAATIGALSRGTHATVVLDVHPAGTVVVGGNAVFDPTLLSDPCNATVGGVRDGGGGSVFDPGFGLGPGPGHIVISGGGCSISGNGGGGATPNPGPGRLVINGGGCSIGGDASISGNTVAAQIMFPGDNYAFYYYPTTEIVPCTFSTSNAQNLNTATFNDGTLTLTAKVPSSGALGWTQTFSDTTTPLTSASLASSTFSPALAWSFASGVLTVTWAGETGTAATYSAVFGVVSNGYGSGGGGGGGGSTGALAGTGGSGAQYGGGGGAGAYAAGGSGLGGDGAKGVILVNYTAALVGPPLWDIGAWQSSRQAHGMASLWAMKCVITASNANPVKPIQLVLRAKAAGICPVPAFATIRFPALTCVARAGQPGVLITDATAVFQPFFKPKPAYLTPTTDETFMTTVTRVTGDPGTALPGGLGGTWGYDSRHEYSIHQPWSADGSLLLIQNATYCPQGGCAKRLFLDGTNYMIKFTTPASYPNTSIYEERWHPATSHATIMVLAGGSSLLWYDVVQQTTTRSWTLPITALYFGNGKGNITQDGRYVLMHSATQMCIVDMNAWPTTRIGPVVNIPLTDSHGNTYQVTWATITPSGKYVDVHYNYKNGVNGDWDRVFDVDPTTLNITLRTTLDPSRPFFDGGATDGFVYNIGHSDFALNPYDSNEDVLIGQEEAGHAGSAVANTTTINGKMGHLPMVRLRDGAVTSLTDPSNEAFVFHVSCRALNRPGWAYVTYWYPQRNMRFNGEVVAVKLDGSGACERFAHYRSDANLDLATYTCPEPNYQYRSEGQAVPCLDGRRLIVASNWQGLGDGGCSIQDYVVDASTQIAPGSP